MIKIRASSWPTLFDCALRWYYDNIVGLRMPSSTGARLGTAIHAGCAAADRGTDTFEAAESAVRVFQNPDEECAPITYSEQRMAERAASACVQSYVSTFGARKFSHIEVEVSECVVETEHGSYMITGHVDRIENGQTKDIKTGVSRVVNGKVKVNADHLQMGIYAIMAKAETGANISNDVTIIGASTRTYEWAEHTIYDAVQIMIGESDDDGMLNFAGKMLKHGLFPPNPKSMLCSEKYCAAFAAKRCKYHG